jgi:flagellin
VQASNATNSKSDREALQAEVKQLTDEIDRVAKQTSFNGTKILDGSFAGALFQVGANAGDNITVGALTDSSAKGLSSINYSTGSVASVDAGDAAVTSFATKIDAGTLTIQVGSGSAIDLGGIRAASSGVQRLGDVVAAINNKSADTGVTAFMTKNDDGTYKLEFMSSKLQADGVTPETVTMSGFTTATTGFDGTHNLAAATGDDIKGIHTLKVDTQKDAWVALKKIDKAIDQVNSARADLGALQSRFENSVNNIDIQAENLSASRGRIVDADFAKETANLSRTQILQQAGVALVERDGDHVFQQRVCVCHCHRHRQRHDHGNQRAAVGAGPVCRVFSRAQGLSGRGRYADHPVGIVAAHHPAPAVHSWCRFPAVGFGECDGLAEHHCGQDQ